MKRIYYLTKSLNSTKSVAKDMDDAGITVWNFHVLGRNEAGLDRADVHTTNLIHERDVIHSGEQGAIVGFAVGVTVASLLGIFNPFELNLGWFALSALCILLTMFGAWVGGLIGLRTENYKIRRFHNQLEEGQYLIMIDVKPSQQKRVVEIMRKLHPEARLAGNDSPLITPFDNYRPGLT